ncbi:MAG: PKD domain-containing protein [Crocinitomicaceae bacterium]
MKKLFLLLYVFAITQANAQAEITTSGSWCEGSYELKITSDDLIEDIMWYHNDELIADENGLSLNCTVYGNGIYRAEYTQGGVKKELTETVEGHAFKAKIEAMNVPAAAVTVFKDASVAEEEIVAWKWDFGNGETSTEQNQKVMYKEEKTYTVHLMVTTASGCVNETIISHRWAYE